jgi:predicted phage baseplate assembly protein
MRGLVTFGNGERGRVVPKDAPVFARYDSTRARAGDLPAGAITKLADSPHNRAILGGSFGVLESRLNGIKNSLPAAGGTDAETLRHAIGRALESVNKTGRAVTLRDYEALARETPGTQIARVSARANSHSSFPCLNAQGIISVVALPYLPPDRPFPSAGLLAAVHDYLFPRRVIGTRVEVVGPVYKEVIVQAQVKALPHASRLEVGQRIIASLNHFFHPLQGGPDGSGWPFGRDVFRSEVLQVIDETPGVDHVNSLALASGCGEPQCGNLCLADNELVAAGAHQIEVV